VTIKTGEIAGPWQVACKLRITSFAMLAPICLFQGAFDEMRRATSQSTRTSSPRSRLSRIDSKVSNRLRQRARTAFRRLDYRSIWSQTTTFYVLKKQ